MTEPATTTTTEENMAKEAPQHILTVYQRLEDTARANAKRATDDAIAFAWYVAADAWNRVRTMALDLDSPAVAKAHDLDRQAREITKLREAA